MVDTSGTQSALRDLEGASGSEQDIRRRDAHIGERHLTVAEGFVEVAHRGQHAVHPHPGGVDRDEHHRVPAVPVGVGVGDAHEDEDLAVGVADAGGEPFGAVDDDVVAVEDGAGCHVGGIRRRDRRLGHAEGAADVGAQQRLEPLLALLGGAVAQQDLHVAGVGGAAIEDDRRKLRDTHRLGQRRVVDVGQARTAVGPEVRGVAPGVRRGQEEVPQAFLACLGLQLRDQRRRLPRVSPAVAAARDVAVDDRLHGVDLGGDEGANPLGQLSRPR